MDLVHHNRVRGARIRHVNTQHSYMHFQVLEETAGVTLPSRLTDGDIPRGRAVSNVHGSASRFGCGQRRDADELRVLRTWITR